jgi:hypothetical protein
MVPFRFNQEEGRPMLRWSTKRSLAAAAIALVVGFAWSAAQATPIPLGFISWDVTVPGSFGQFDIVNQTGPNSSPPTWPVSTQVQFSSLSLVVDFSDGSTTTFGSAYFTLNPDGESLDGSPIAIGGVSPLPTKAILTGDLTPTTIDVNGTSTTVDASFDAATILPSSPPDLSDGDFAIINAETGIAPPVPEPDMADIARGRLHGSDFCPPAPPGRCCQGPCPSSSPV